MHPNGIVRDCARFVKPARVGASIPSQEEEFLQDLFVGLIQGKEMENAAEEDQSRAWAKPLIRNRHRQAVCLVLDKDESCLAHSGPTFYGPTED